MYFERYNAVTSLVTTLEVGFAPPSHQSKGRTLSASCGCPDLGLMRQTASSLFRRRLVHVRVLNPRPQRFATRLPLLRSHRRPREVFRKSAHQRVAASLSDRSGGSRQLGVHYERTGSLLQREAIVGGPTNSQDALEPTTIPQKCAQGATTQHPSAPISRHVGAAYSSPDTLLRQTWA